MTRPLILLTNDDGIDSPGLAAAAFALDPLGELLILAPLHQQTSASRSRPPRVVQGGLISRRSLYFEGQQWQGFAVDATPAVAVDHGIQELAQRPVALAVSGINFGENVSTCVTVSGTVGAALQAAEYGVLAIAASLAVNQAALFSHDSSVDFSVAAHFLRYFAQQAMSRALPDDVDVLKIEVPAQATEDTPWVVTPLDRFMYYKASFSKRDDVFNDPTEMNLIIRKGEFGEQGTDGHALAQGLVSVTPLSLDMTSRVNLKSLRALIAGDEQGG